MARVIETISETELASRLRNVSLLKDVEVKPYKDATISIRAVDLTLVRPTTLYVLRQNLRFQSTLSCDLREQGFDVFALEGALTLQNEGQETGLTPPIVEVDAEHGPCLIDGGHRSYIARSTGRMVINALWIENADPRYPIYAYPNEWGDIAEYDTIPSVKKHYREGDYSALYRNFSSLNGSAMRQTP